MGNIIPSGEDAAADDYWFVPIMERMWDVLSEYETAKQGAATEERDMSERTIADMMVELVACERELTSREPGEYDGVVLWYTGVDLSMPVEIGHLGLVYSSESMRETSQQRYDAFVVNRLRPMLLKTFGGLKSFTRSNRAQLDVDYWTLARLEDDQYAKFREALSEELLALFSEDNSSHPAISLQTKPSDEEILSYLQATMDKNILTLEKLQKTREWIRRVESERQRHPGHSDKKIYAIVSRQIKEASFSEKDGPAPDTIRKSIVSFNKAVNVLQSS